jgi:hypothetical protein
MTQPATPKRKIRSHKGGRTAILNTHITPAHLARLRSHLAQTGQSYADWVEEMIDDRVEQYSDDTEYWALEPGTHK